jgi:hypothetical protein
MMQFLGGAAEEVENSFMRIIFSAVIPRIWCQNNARYIISDHIIYGFWGLALLLKSTMGPILSIRAIGMLAPC